MRYLNCLLIAISIGVMTHIGAYGVAAFAFTVVVLLFLLAILEKS